MSHLSTFTTLVNLAVAVGLPALVALVTRQLAASWYKGLILLFLSSATGALTQLTGATHGSFQWTAWLLSWSETYVVAVAAHFGLLKNIVTGSNGVIARKIPAGIGVTR